MLRIYLSGRMTLEGGGALLGPERFPGQQGRLLFAYLVTHRRGPVSRAALAAALWQGSPPAAWDAALSSIVSKLRTLLAQAGVDGSTALAAVSGTYEARLPADAWIDHEAAEDALHHAESAIGVGEFDAAYGPSAVALLIARRPFLPGEDAPWIEQRREKLSNILVRALECRVRVYSRNEEYSLAAELAREVVTLRPFRESGYRLLMRAHAASGNAAEALRVYEECRAVISEELGVGPSAETRAVHQEVLRSV